MAFGTIMGQKPLVNAEDVEGILSPDNIPNIDMSKLTGVLPLLKGGTGVTNIGALKSLLGIGEQVKFYVTSYYGQGRKDNSVLSSIGFTPKSAIYFGISTSDSKTAGINIVIVGTRENTANQLYISIVNSGYVDYSKKSPSIDYNSNGLTISVYSSGSYGYYENASIPNYQYLAIAFG